MLTQKMQINVYHLQSIRRYTGNNVQISLLIGFDQGRYSCRAEIRSYYVDVSKLVKFPFKNNFSIEPLF